MKAERLDDRSLAQHDRAGRAIVKRDSRRHGIPADGEALRNDEAFAYVAAWAWTGEGSAQALHKEPLVYENIKLSQRSYK